MGLQQNIQKQLAVPINNILHSISHIKNKPEISITNIFNATQFTQLIITFIPENIPHHPKQIYLYEDVWQLLKSCAKVLGIEMRNYEEPSSRFMNREKIDYEEQGIQNETWSDLRELNRILFQIMLKNQEVLYLITKMQEKYQLQIKEYIESNEEFNSHSKVQGDSPTAKNYSKGGSMTNFNNQQLLLDKIEELQHALLTRDTELNKTQQKLSQNKQELLLIKSVLQQKQQQLKILKKRISAYSQADVLFEQKDEQISKLNSELTQLKLRSHIKTTELHNQISKLKQKINQIQLEKNQLVLSNEELVNKNQLLTVNKEESQIANKKVIANLKQKIKTLNQRIAEQQKNMMDVLMEKQQRQKQLFELEKKTSHMELIKKSKFLTKNDDLKNSSRKSSNLMDELGDVYNMLETSAENYKYFQVLFGDMEGRCTGQVCIALRSQYVRVVQQILNINNDTDSLIYITPQNRLQCILKQLQKLHETCQQNLKLKQKIILLQSEGGKGQTSKQSLQQINKLKKKLLVMKRNIDQVQNKRKEEIEILIGVINQNIVFNKA